MPAAVFLRDYWQKRPLLVRQAFPGFESPISPEDLAGLACLPLLVGGLAAVLTVGALIGIRLAAPWIGRIPDRVHAWVYIGLLIIVLLCISLK